MVWPMSAVFDPSFCSMGMAVDGAARPGVFVTERGLVRMQTRGAPRTSRPSTGPRGRFGQRCWSGHQHISRFRWHGFHAVRAVLVDVPHARDANSLDASVFPSLVVCF